MGGLGSDVLGRFEFNLNALGCYAGFVETINSNGTRRKLRRR
jgi:hypothetical protein